MFCFVLINCLLDEFVIFFFFGVKFYINYFLLFKLIVCLYKYLIICIWFKKGMYLKNKLLILIIMKKILNCFEIFDSFYND